MQRLCAPPDDRNPRALPLPLLGKSREHRRVGVGHVDGDHRDQWGRRDLQTREDAGQWSVARVGVRDLPDVKTGNDARTGRDDHGWAQGLQAGHGPVDQTLALQDDQRLVLAHPARVAAGEHQPGDVHAAKVSDAVTTDRASARPLLPSDEVRARIRGIFRAPAPRLLPIGECLGLVLAEDVTATEPLPRAATAAMDGFAVRASDTPGRLRITGHAYAGSPSAAPLGLQEAVTIGTGAWLPEGADSVVQVEAATASGGTVEVPAVVVGRHVRVAGEDVAAGGRVLAAGSRLGPLQLAAAAGLGRAELLVQPRPAVAVIPTGDEVRSPGSPLAAGQVHDAVSIALAALLHDAGARPELHPPTPDDPEVLRRRLQTAAQGADLILTVGGVSVGERDVVAGMPDAQALAVALRPGRPLVLGRVDGVGWCGLPGNPVAAFAAFEELVRPVLGAPARSTVCGPLTTSITPAPDRLTLVPCDVSADGIRPLEPRRVGPLTALGGADGWLRVPSGAKPLLAGTTVEVQLLRRRSSSDNSAENP